MDDTPPKKAAPYNPSRGAYINAPKTASTAPAPAKPAQPFSGRMPPMASQKTAASDPAPVAPAIIIDPAPPEPEKPAQQYWGRMPPMASPKKAASDPAPAMPQPRGDPTGLNQDLGDDDMDQTDKLAE